MRDACAEACEIPQTYEGPDERPRGSWEFGHLWQLRPDESGARVGYEPETRMGKGKGNPESWVAVVKPGRIMFETEGVSEQVARQAFTLAAAKLPVRTRFVTREGE